MKPPTPQSLPSALVLTQPADAGLSPEKLRPGQPCPRCHKGKLDYNGLLNLACDACGFTLAGCFT